MIRDTNFRKSSSLWRKIVLFLMMCNIVFAILNPGKFFELADYYYFVLTICFQITKTAFWIFSFTMIPTK